MALTIAILLNNRPTTKFVYLSNQKENVASEKQAPLENNSIFGLPQRKQIPFLAISLQ